MLFKARLDDWAGLLDELDGLVADCVAGFVGLRTAVLTVGLIGARTAVNFGLSRTFLFAFFLAFARLARFARINFLILTRADLHFLLRFLAFFAKHRRRPLPFAFLQYLLISVLQAFLGSLFFGVSPVHH